MAGFIGLLLSLSINAAHAEDYRMAVMGNSIAAGYLAHTDGVKGFAPLDPLYRLIKWAVRRPSYNFATGKNINSHCQRLKSQWGGSWKCENLAVGGSEISDVALDQLRDFVEFDADYAVLEIGANDICDTRMTPVEEFEYYAEMIADALSVRLGRMNVIVALPDLTALYDLKDKKCFLGMKCSKVWNITKSCKTITDGVGLEDVREQIKAYNKVLQDISATHGFYYTEKTAMLRFEAKHVSKVDGFHPSREGQELLSELTYPFEEEK